MGILPENDYLLKWFDLNTWRSSYYNLMKHALAKPIKTADQLWTFDILQFPYVAANCLLKQPERSDIEQRPRNLKPRVSVLFAFSASGDYLQPYFVYPQTFEDEQQELNANECYSPNGYVSFRIFENWLFKLFLPYLQQQQEKNSPRVTFTATDFVLLFCAKLAIIDKRLLYKFFASFIFSPQQHIFF